MSKKLRRRDSWFGRNSPKAVIKTVSTSEWVNWLNQVSHFYRNYELNPLFVENSSSQRPFITVRIGNQDIVALLDSGADRSVIGAKGLSLLKSLNFDVFKATKITVTTADGKPQKIMGSARLPINLKGNLKFLEVLVIPSIKHNLILGVDFCQAFGISIDFKKSSWSSRDKEYVLDSVNVINDVETLSESQKLKLASVTDLFKNLTGLGKTDLVEHRIDTGDSLPIKQRYYPISPAMQVHLNKELDKMLELGVVRESSSPWSSPVLLVKKSSGEFRLCFDGRKLNSVSKKDSYPLPYVNNILNKLRDARYLSSIDLKNAFWQIPLESSSIEKTAFTVPNRGLFEFVRMPFGLQNAAQAQQRLMDRIFPETLQPHIFTYLDDIVIATDTFEKHLEVIREVYERLKGAGLTVNAEKCKFCRSSLKYLGFIVDQGGLRTDPEKISAIQEYSKPTNVTELKRFLGVCSWYRRFVKDFSQIVHPLNDLMKGKVKKQVLVWNEEAEAAFEQLKEKLVTAPVLASPDFDKPFVIQTDASDSSVGAVLTQGDTDNEHPISYVSRTLTKAERNFSVTERECLAVIFAIEKFRPYVEGTKFKVITDHYSLLWLQRIKDPSGRLARWSVRLQQFDFDLEHRKGKFHVVPDFLSRLPAEVSLLEANEDDKWYHSMIQRVQDNPENYPWWRVEENQLFKFIANRSGIQTNQREWKMVVPRSKRHEIIQRHHDDPLAAHLGTFKTFRRIALEYYWPKMRRDIHKYVLRCKVCSQQKVSQTGRIGLMGNPKEVSMPFQLVSIDIAGPYPRSTKGFQYLLVVSDYFTKFTVLHPMRNATASEVVQFVENQVFLVYGVPQIIVCDNGVQFTSNMFRDLIKRYDIPKLWYNARYHAQTNPVERINRVVITAVSSYIRENHRLWDQQIHKIGSAIRLAVHEVTGYSPVFLNFGRDVPVSGKFYGTIEDNAPVGERDAYATELRKLPELYLEVKKRLLAAHERNARHYNLRKRSIEFNEGDVVWKKNYVLSNAANNFCAKLAPKYVECRVIRKASPLVYELVDMRDKNLGRWHVKDLKPGVEFRDSDEE